MKTRFLLAIGSMLAALAAPAAQARLGDPVKTVETRFGASIGRAPYRLDRRKLDRRVYYEPGWVVLVTYWEGHSVHEQYFRIANPLPREFVREWFSLPGSFWERPSAEVFLRNLGRHSEGLSNQEIRTILLASADGRHWEMQGKRNLFFVRADHEALGRYVHRGDDGESFLVVTTDFEQRLNDALGDGDLEQRARTGRLRTF